MVEGLIFILAVHLLGLVTIVAVTLVVATVAAHSRDPLTHVIVVLEVGVIVVLVFVRVEICLAVL